MQAIILASGTGTRLLPLTQSLPKGLLKVGNKLILERIIDSLVDNSINNLIITTGYKSKKICNFIRKHYLKLSPIHVYNKYYIETNYIYSLYLANKHVKSDEDIILLHSDLVFKAELLSKIINAKNSSVLVKTGSVPENYKDFLAKISMDKVKQISVDINNDDGGDVLACMPCYKFNYDDWLTWMLKINEFITNNEKKCYAENALNEVLDKIDMRMVSYQEEHCLEVDTISDFKKANILFKNT